ITSAEATAALRHLLARDKERWNHVMDEMYDSLTAHDDEVTQFALDDGLNLAGGTCQCANHVELDAGRLSVDLGSLPDNGCGRGSTPRGSSRLNSRVARELPSGTVTFVFTDVEGSTRLMLHVGTDAYADVLA